MQGFVITGCYKSCKTWILLHCITSDWGCLFNFVGPYVKNFLTEDTDVQKYGQLLLLPPPPPPWKL